ncbi:MAG: ribosomal protein S18-alanine N-acetyltransferase [Phascolarctobacterium sp.]|nr:ribosomal protein S18-alanine N-acetyltransferase [Phascolarctobacterium sp.]
MGEETTKIIFRNMTSDDLDFVCNLEAESFHDAWNTCMLEKELNNDLATYIIMEANGKKVGYAGFWNVIGEAQVTRVAVSKAERGRGYGMLLTQALAEAAWQLGAEAVTLEVRESNLIAQKTYKKCGFKSVGIRPGYYGDTHEGAVIMWLYE